MPEVKFKFNKPGESPGFLLWQLTMLWQRKIKEVLDQLDLTHTQFVLLATLAWLSGEKKTVSQADIAGHSRTDRMMVSKILQTLQDKGLIRRGQHESDTRAKAVTLTTRGRSVLQKALTLVENTDIKFFSVLGSQSGTFNAGMNKLIEKNK